MAAGVLRLAALARRRARARAAGGDGLAGAGARGAERAARARRVPRRVRPPAPAGSAPSGRPFRDRCHRGRRTGPHRSGGAGAAGRVGARRAAASGRCGAATRSSTRPTPWVRCGRRSPTRSGSTTCRTPWSYGRCARSPRRARVGRAGGRRGGRGHRSGTRRSGRAAGRRGTGRGCRAPRPPYCAGALILGLAAVAGRSASMSRPLLRRDVLALPARRRGRGRRGPRRPGRPASRVRRSPRWPSSPRCCWCRPATGTGLGGAARRRARGTQVDSPWVPGLDLRFHLGVDGISYPLIVLTTLLTLLCCLYTIWHVPDGGRGRDARRADAGRRGRHPRHVPRPRPRAVLRVLRGRAAADVRDHRRLGWRGPAARGPQVRALHAVRLGAAAGRRVHGRGRRRHRRPGHADRPARRPVPRHPARRVHAAGDRVRGEEPTVAAAHLAARRAHPGADGGQRDPGRRAAEDGHVRADPGRRRGGAGGRALGLAGARARSRSPRSWSAASSAWRRPS